MALIKLIVDGAEVGSWEGSLVGPDAAPVTITPSQEALTAAAVTLDPPATIAPPSSFFTNPNLTAATPLTIDDNGYIYGHLATWDSCHIGYESCVVPPKSSSSYQYFHTGTVLTSDGHNIPVGHITLGTGHASLQADAQSAAAHYDNTGTVVADVIAGEDSHGIYISGYIRPGTDELKIYQLRAAALSGDWRPINNSLELVAALAVNVPGFPIPRAQAILSDGTVMALVGSNVISPPAEWEAPIASLQSQLDNLAASLRPLLANHLKSKVDE